jgi:branched-chain amino acid transport system substrate-binding protein
MEIRCTRPSCANPRNVFPEFDDDAILKTVQQRFCTTCGMPLLLDGRYLPTKLLGKGGFGAAYLSYDRRSPTNNSCVVKQFQPQAQLDPAQLKIAHTLFDREAEFLEKLGSDHKQIPKLLAYFPLSVADSHTGEQCQFFYLVQEYIDGLTLEQTLEQRGRFSEGQVLEMLRSILGVLDYIHRNGVIHRDIKPSNIMQHKNGTYYLLDFGTVKQVTQSTVMATGTGSSTGVFTSGYAPPEQIAGQNIYPSTDLYALAVTALVLLTGKLNPLDCFDAYSNRYERAVDVLNALGMPLETSGPAAIDAANAPTIRPFSPPPSGPPTVANPSQPPAGYPSGPPGTAYPSSPPAGYPSSPPVGYPSNPPAGYPSNPPAGYPSNPPAGYPSNPPAGYPSNPPAGYPSNPAAGYPPNPAAGYLSNPPAAGYPSNPPTGYPQNPPGSVSQGPQGYSAYPSNPPGQLVPYSLSSAGNDVGQAVSPYGTSSQARAKKWVRPALILGIIALLGLGGCGIYSLIKGGGGEPATVGGRDNGNAKTERLSLGDRRLIEDDGSADKNAAIDAYKSKDYDKAIDGLETSLKSDPNDPEALIYLNNAKIGDQKSYTIAVSVPLDAEDQASKDAAKEILRGVAQAQNTVNADGGIKGVPLKILIVTDTNKEESTEAVAKTLVKEEEVLAVVGHFGSDATIAAAKVYQENKLVMVTPTSTSTALSSIGNHIFRTVPSDNFTGKALSRYMLESLNKKKAAVFYNADSGYSRSLRDVFTESLLSSGGEVVEEVDLNSKEFNPETSYKMAQEQGAEVIVILANSATLPQSFKLLEVNQKKLPIIGGDSPYRVSTLENGKNTEGMILAVPWHAKGDPAATFPKEASQLWKGDVSWRTAMTYDATETIIAALAVDPSREGIQKALKDPNFSTQGSAGTIKFLASGDRNRPAQLVKVVPGNHPSGYVFVPLK